MKILLVEDDIVLGELLENLLKANHFQVHLARDGLLGLARAIETEYDLILLDVNVPQLDGLSLCRQLRSQGYRKPILLLTADDSDAGAIAGFDAGADDYISKPCAPEVLLARMRTLLRRSGALVSAKSPHQATTTLNWGNLSLDLDAGRVTFNGHPITLTATEYNLLELFLRNPDRIFSRNAILDRLWGFDEAPTDRAIVTHVKDVRKKLKAGGLSEDLIETVYGMGYRLKPPPNQVSQAQLLTPGKAHPDSLALDSQSSAVKNSTPNRDTLLKRFLGIINDQVSVLERARVEFLAQNLPLELHQASHQEAHKLAGSLASFGYPEGSKLARSIEHLLRSQAILSPESISQFSEWVLALQLELTKAPVVSPATPVPWVQTYRVLVIDDDYALTERLKTEAEAWGLRLKIALNPTEARSRLAISTPDLVLLDLSFPETEEDGLLLLREILERFPNLPVIVFTARDSLADRLAVSRLGAQQFLHKPATTDQIFQTIARVVSKPQSTQAKVLIVDDDPGMLALLSTMLTPWGLEITTLSQPQNFWKILVAASPNLILLDLEMPQVSGLELCRIVRLDMQWGDIPILVVTAHTDAESLQQAFAAGADDFITKPILGPELITRVLGRIERNRLLPGIGIMNSKHTL